MHDPIEMIREAIAQRDRPMPPDRWWRKGLTVREMDIGEHMYARGARLVLREWEMERMQEGKRTVGVDIEKLEFKP
jgi:hypothetical protein